jgi:aerobic carbon-monoxide dehydrogenase large subunit
MSGGAIVAVSDKIIAKGKKLAAHLLEASEGDVEFKDGRMRLLTIREELHAFFPAMS